MYGETNFYALNNRIWNQIINYIEPVVSIIFIQKRWMKKNFMEKEELDRGLNRICSLGEQSERSDSDESGLLSWGMVKGST